MSRQPHLTLCSPVLKHSGALVLLALGSLGGARPGQAQVQGECRVTSTISGRWTRVELNCGEPEGTRPRVAVVGAEDLRTCPLLVGDRVSVTFLYDDPTRRPTVNSVIARGDGGPSSGDWCGRAFPPGRYTGPCLIEEDPRRQLRSDTLGAQWTRRSVGTLLRDADGLRRSIAE